MKTLLISVVVASLSGACAIIPEHVEVNYVPDPSFVRTRAVATVSVSLQATDARHAESPDWLADKKNGYGMRLASVLAQKPVVDLVRDAVAQELTALGIKVGEKGTAVSIDIVRLESVYQTRFFSVGAIASADLFVQVRRSDASVAYAHTFSTSNDNEADLAGTAGQARRSVETALSKIVGQIISDPAFIAALSTGRPNT